MPNLRGILKIVLGVFTVVYPAAVFVMLVVLKVPVRVFSLFALAFGLFFFARSKLTALLFLSAALLCYVTDSALFLKLYPVAVNMTMLTAFASSLRGRESIIFRFARMQDKNIFRRLQASFVRAYCRKVCIVWCGFFVVNAVAVVCITMFASELVWSVYNGGISYVLMGCLFAGEYIIRKVENKKMPKLYPFSEITADCRADDHVVCYDGVWSDGRYKTWLDFLRDTARLRAFIKTKGAKDWLLHCEDSYYFLIAYCALMQCQKNTYLVANTSPGFLAEIKNDANEFFSDNGIPGSLDVAVALAQYPEVPETDVRTCPKIDAETTVFYIFTSGSTGKPKAIYSRLKEYEENNAFNLNQWAAVYSDCKLIDTVSQCHSYGVAYTVQIPFTAGIPFRRKRVMTPSEFEAFTDTKYMIVTVPAFLKRTIESGIRPKMQVEWIYTSGGVLTPDVAKGTDALFGFWPVEMYGSTETCGVGWRQSKNGLAWTPFEGAEIWKTDDGCLGVKSPCVQDPEGFVIKDLVDILPDGRFILNGRADSIVKIEEKRISLVEVENRLLQSGMVNDVSVIALASERRQYLAAALVFTKAGRAHFAGKEKFAINRWFQRYLQQFFENAVIPKKWRYLDEIPMDMQGKKKKLEIQALFTAAE